MGLLGLAHLKLAGFPTRARAPQVPGRAGDLGEFGGLVHPQGIRAHGRRRASEGKKAPHLGEPLSHRGAGRVATATSTAETAPRPDLGGLPLMGFWL